MRLFSKYVQWRKRILREIGSTLEHRLSHARQGLLELKKQQGHVYYIYRKNRKAEGIILKDSNPQEHSLITSLAQQSYDRKILRIIEKELKLITRLDRFYENNQIEMVYERLSPERQALVEPVVKTDDLYAEEWQARRHEQKKPPEEEESFRTERGDRVRSKSEVFAADGFYRHGIPYHYECAVPLVDHTNGKPYTAHPDFLVLNKRTRKEYYYEHFGKMDDPEYAANAVNKLIDYMNAGYFLGDNLLATFETGQAPLKPEHVEKLIEHYLK